MVHIATFLDYCIRKEANQGAVSVRRFVPQPPTDIRRLRILKRRYPVHVRPAALLRKYRSAALCSTYLPLASRPFFSPLNSIRAQK